MQNNDATELFLKSYWLEAPVILRGWHTKAIEQLQNRTRRGQLLKDFGNVEVDVGFPWDLANGGQSAAQQTTTVREYIKTMPGSQYLFETGRFLNSAGLDTDWIIPPAFDKLEKFTRKFR